MSTLLIDIGNTRVKWTRSPAGKVHAAVHSEWGREAWGRLLSRGIERVLVASVAGPKAEGALTAATRRRGLKPEFIRAERAAGGVTVGYLEPWRLGVDRFAALIGARHVYPGQPLLIVGLGTAMTIDFLGADGRHRGGAIIPGPGLMIETLLTRTHGIKRRATGGATGRKGLFGRSTRAAIQQGARFAAASLIERAAAEARIFSPRKPKILLAGGDSREVQTLVRGRCELVPDLVLRGLAVLAGGPS